LQVRNGAYWITTAIVAFLIGGGGLSQSLHMPWNVEGMVALGYPVYFVTILGVWKVLSAITILVPGLPRLKEWAYAGIFFDVTGAAASYVAVCVYGHTAFTSSPPSSWPVSWSFHGRFAHKPGPLECSFRQGNPRFCPRLDLGKGREMRR
jgi:hypothetical protein